MTSVNADWVRQGSVVRLLAIGWAGLCLFLIGAQSYYSGKQHAWPIVLYLIPLWCVVGVWNYVESSALLAYMRATHLDRWNDLTYGVSGSFRGGRILRFVWGSEFDSEPEIARLRRQVRKAIVFQVAVFVHIPLAVMLANWVAVVCGSWRFR